MKSTERHRKRRQRCFSQCRKGWSQRRERITARPPFHVFATQNPIEQEGTYPVPEARTALCSGQVEYPTEREVTIVSQTTGLGDVAVEAVVSREELLRCQGVVRAIVVSPDAIELCRSIGSEYQAPIGDGITLHSRGCVLGSWAACESISGSRCKARARWRAVLTLLLRTFRHSRRCLSIGP